MATSRRDFLIGSVTGLGAAMTGGVAWAGRSANEEIGLALIGCGGRGSGMYNVFSNFDGVRFTALCDPDSERLANFAERNPSAAQVADVRDALDRDDVDAVVITTSNHWHCLAGLWALEAGKHVYVEKPLFHNHAEGMLLVEAAERTGLVVQVGTQQRSDPMQAGIKSLLHEQQQLGGVRGVSIRRFGVRRPIGKRSTPLAVPKSVNYDLWLGPAADEPLFRNQLHYDWHWNWNTGAGEMGNWGVHIVDDVRNNVFLDKVAYPSTVVAGGGRVGWDDAGQTPNAQVAWFDADGVPVTISVCNLASTPGGKNVPKAPGPACGYTVFCEGGRLEGQRGMAVAFDAEGREIARFKGSTGIPEHQHNFIDAIRKNDPASVTADAETGFYSTAWCDMANIATRVGHAESAGSGKRPATDGRPMFVEERERLAAALAPHNAPSSMLAPGPVLRFDDQERRFTGASSALANDLLTREPRADYRPNA